MPGDIPGQAPVVPPPVDPNEEAKRTAKHGADSRESREKLIFDQDLNEVYLLIDFVSGRSDRSLSKLTIHDPGTDGKTLSAEEVVETISKMRYPIPRDEDVATARNASILLLSKDQLSFMTKPARGSTIAYTSMFVDAEANYISSLTRLLPSKCKEIFGIGLPVERKTEDSRIDLAQRTFPGLQEHARRFATRRIRLGLFTLIWLCLTLLAYSDAGLGRSALERLDQDWKAQLAEVAKNPLLLHCAKGNTFGNTDSTDSAWLKAVSGKDPPTALEQGKALLDCRQYNYARWLSWSAGKEVESVFKCDPYHLLIHVWCWRFLLPGTFDLPAPDIKTTDGKTEEIKGAPQAVNKDADAPDYIKHNATFWQTATLTLTVFTTFILPMMFALLAALIAGFRTIARLVGDSELSPRDYVRMQLGIPIGLVAGVAVGLFLSPSSVPMQGSGGISGQLTLTASGLGFIAGYAAERFFRFIDNLATTALPDRSNTPETAPRSGQPPQP